MNLYDFKYLTVSEQVQAIRKSGAYLSNRGQDSFLIMLYRLHDFYIEVYFDFRHSELSKIISFHSDVLLQPYLDRVNITSLFSDPVLHSDNY